MVETKTVVMDTDQIKKLIPHRHPLLLIEQVHHITPQNIVASKRLTAQEPVFEGHFPGNPIYPGVYYIEAIAQAGAVLIYSQPEAKKYIEDGYLGVLTSVQEAKFRKPCVPGDLVCYEVTLEKSRGLFFWLKGKVIVNDEVAAEASLSVALTK